MPTNYTPTLPMKRLLRTLMRGAERLPIPVVIKDGQLRWRYANEAACELFGLATGGYHHQTDADLLEPAMAAQSSEDDHAALALRDLGEMREVIGGRSFRVFRYPLRDAHAGVSGLLVLALEVTELEASRLAFERQRDFYTALSEVTQAVIRDESHGPAELYDSVCRLIVQHTAAIMAVVGQVDHDAALVRFVHQREKFEYLPILRGLQVALDPEDPHGHGPAARAVREGHTVVVGDVAQDAGMAPWSELHREYGVRSAIAVPVTLNGVHELVLVVYAAERDFFTPDLVHLLRDMADDIGFSVLHQRQADRLRHLALYDSLTALPNRLQFFDRAASVVEDDLACTLLVLDIDDFKFYNDLFGNDAGDSLLQIVGERLQSLCADGDVVGRLGSDEFGLLLRADGRIDESTLQQRLASVVGAPYELGLDSPVSLRLSGGYALHPQDGRDVDTLVRRAGMALQAVKTEGGNGLRGYQPAQEETLDRRREVRAEIERALAEGRVEPWFQPQIDLLTGAVVGLEALARLRAEDGSIIAPDWFIDIVESDASLIRRLGVAMLDGVGVRLPELQGLGLDVPVSVNVGARHLLAPGFGRDLAELLGRHPLLASRLEIEITESENLADIPRAVKILRWVRSRGLGVALDDFGSGYASVGNVRQLPLTTLKLDQDFVRDLPASGDDQTIVSAVVVGVRGLGVRLIAEGVELDEHAELLGALGVTLLQGYAISRPLPLGELERWIRVWRPPASWRRWARPPSQQGSALICVGAWFGLRRWLTRPEGGEPQAVRRFRERLESDDAFQCPPPLSEFSGVFLSLCRRASEAAASGGPEGARERDELLAEIDAMGRLMRRSIGRTSLIG